MYILGFEDQDVGLKVLLSINLVKRLLKTLDISWVKKIT